MAGALVVQPQNFRVLSLCVFVRGYASRFVRGLFSDDFFHFGLTDQRLTDEFILDENWEPPIGKGLEFSMHTLEIITEVLHWLTAARHRPIKGP